jgi:ABC-type multidrug transport system fused ATPase/permease subunit
MLNKILTLIDGYKKPEIFFIIFLIFFSSILEFFSIGIIIPIIFYFANPSTETTILLSNSFLISFNLEFEREYFLKYLLFIILLFFFIRFLFLNYLSFKLHAFIGSCNQLIKENLLKIYITKNYSWHTNNNKTKFIHLLNQDVDNFCLNSLFGFMFIVSELFLFTGIISFLLFYNSKIFFYLLILSFFFFPTLYYFTKKFSFTLGKKVMDRSSQILIDINEGLSGIKELILYGWGEKIKISFKEKISKLIKDMALFNSLQEISRYTLEFSAVIIFILFIFFLNFESDNLTSIITIGLFATAIFRIMPLLNRISTYSQRLRFGLSAGDKILKFYQDTANIMTIKKNMDFKNYISLENVDFKFDKSNKNLLNNVNIEIKKNELIGIIGDNGSGKTTITNIIMGLLDPTKGSILVDNVNIIKNNLSISDSIGFVPQNFFSFDSTLINNIVFFEKKINFKNLKFALKNSLLLKSIFEKKLSLKTVLGNNSLKISGGQLQRVNIARALYRNPKLLILDEPTSSIDNYSKDLFEKILINLKDKMSVIIITHNLKSKDIFDKIYKVENTNVERVK